MGLSEVEILIIPLAIVTSLTALLLWGNRPTPERFAAANGITLDDETATEVATALRRTYRGRLLGGGAGFLVALALTSLGETRLSFTGGLAAILAGTLIGIALAQFTRSTDTGAVRVASLEARDADDYRPRYAKATIGSALVVLLGGAVIALIGHDSSTQLLVIAISAASIATVGLGIGLQRRIVERAHDHRNEEHARVDGALRASAVRAVHHATVGILLCGIALIGATIANPATIRVYTDPGFVTGHAKLAFELPGTSTDITTVSDNETSRLEWTDTAGVRHARGLVNTPTDHHVLSTERSYDVPAVLVTIFILVGVLAGIGALLEWRAAARAWRRPGPRRWSDPTATIALTPSGAAS